MRAEVVAARAFVNMSMEKLAEKKQPTGAVGSDPATLVRLLHIASGNFINVSRVVPRGGNCEDHGAGFVGVRADAAVCALLHAHLLGDTRAASSAATFAADIFLSLDDDSDDSDDDHNDISISLASEDKSKLSEQEPEYETALASSECHWKLPINLRRADLLLSAAKTHNSPTHKANDIRAAEGAAVEAFSIYSTALGAAHPLVACLYESLQRRFC